MARRKRGRYGPRFGSMSQARFRELRQYYESTGQSRARAQASAYRTLKAQKGKRNPFYRRRK